MIRQLDPLFGTFIFVSECAVPWKLGLQDEVVIIGPRRARLLLDFAIEMIAIGHYSISEFLFCSAETKFKQDIAIDADSESYNLLLQCVEPFDGLENMIASIFFIEQRPQRIWGGLRRLFLHLENLCEQKESH